MKNIEFRHFITQDDRNNISSILSSTDFFYNYEISVALEIADEYLSRDDHNGYGFLAAIFEERMIGFTSYGLIPCTKDSYDLYWIAVHNDYRGEGIGLKLLLKTEENVSLLGGKRIFIETSSTPKYEPTQGFYIRAGYTLEASLKDYYRDGDDKLMYSKLLNPKVK